MTFQGKRVALIGGGNMGTALAEGLIASRLMKPAQISITDVRQERLRSLKNKLGVRVGTNNADAVRSSDVILLCVKPQQMAELLAEIGQTVTPRQTVVSIAAGVRTRFIEERLERGVPVIRVMPNTPALLRAGALVYFAGRFVRRQQEKIVREILSSAGEVWKASREDWMDSVTALSGSGPAYVFYLAECLEKAGRKLGLPGPLAESLARQTIYGAGLMLKGSPETAAVLRQRVTSPGGTTEAALRVMDRAAMPKILEKALQAARKRSQELSGK